MLGLVITVAVVALAGGIRIVSAHKDTGLIRTGAGDRLPVVPTAVHTLSFLPDSTYYCFGGDLTSPTTVALVGDSHAAMWFNALSDVGKRTVSGC